MDFSKMKFNEFLFLALALICFSFFSCTQKNDTLTFDAMDTLITIKSNGKNAKAANQKAKEEIERIENLISVTKENSTIKLLNDAKDSPHKLDGETYFLIDFALRIARQTGGALNPFLYPATKLWGFTTGNFKVPSQNESDSVLKFIDFSKVKLKKHESRHFLTMQSGMQCDLGAVGKGYASDRAKQILKENGIESAVIDLGGNINLLGAKKTGGKIEDWKVGIKNPFFPQKNENLAIGFITANDKAIVTSGGYERFFTDDEGNIFIHIFDSKTAKPVENDIASVTVVAQSGLYADSLSTALFVLGKNDAENYWKAHRDFEYLIVFKDGSVFCSQGLKNDFTLLR
ncbi:FAD:protein FMN transferase [Treponema pectinovorum]|uniref:FAD:protein FMN transferase n=1 Tax=Treponema pectinovorum TaxID=164 RepID=UPI0011CA88D7|nr:FAD:protein FMN transferase [Treponema pectinovorum]